MIRIHVSLWEVDAIFCFKRVGKLFDIFFFDYIYIYMYIYTYIYIDRQTNVGFPRLVVFHRTVSRD